MAKSKNKTPPSVVDDAPHGGPTIQVANRKTGEVGEMSAAEYQSDPDNFASQGWVPISHDQVEPLLAHQREEEGHKGKLADAESFTGHLKTGGENFVAGAVDAFTALPRAVSAAASHLAGKEDPFAEMTGRDLLTSFSGVRSLQDLTQQVSVEEAKRQNDFREAMATRAQQNPITAGVSQVAGAVLGAEAGGLGALGSLARGSTAGALGGGAAARVAGRAAQGALEGAPLAMTAEQDQAYQEGRRLTGEQAFAALGQGLLLGGAAGGGFGALGEGLGAAGKKAASVGRGLLKPSEETYDKVISGVTKQEAAPGAGAFLRRGFGGEDLSELLASASPDEAPAITQAQAVLERAHEGSGQLEGIGDKLIGHKLKGALLGSMLHGPAGAAVGMAGSAAYDFAKTSLTNPARFLEQRVLIERAAEKTQNVISQTLGGFFAGVGKTTETVAPSRRLVTALELFQGSHKTPEEAYQKRADEILALTQNYGEQIRQNAGEMFGSAFDHDPQAVGAAISAATSGADFLQSKLPVPIFDANSLTPNASRPKPSRLELQNFAETWAAVVHPLKVLQGLPHGLVSPDQMKTIQSVSPNFYNYIRDQVDEKIRDFDARGIEIPIRQRQILDQAFSLDGAGEPTFSAEFAMTYGPQMADHRPEQRPPPRPGAGRTKMSARFSTRTNKMLDDEV